jgi:hypothetical protein
LAANDNRVVARERTGHLAKRAATYISTGRWKRLEDVETTGWEDVGELPIDSDYHAAFLRTFGSKEHSEETTCAHPGVIMCLMLGALRNAFPVPLPDTDEELAHLHTNESLESFSTPRIGDVCRLIGRLTANVDARVFRYEGWLMSSDGLPLVKNTFDVCMVSRARATAR